MIRYIDADALLLDIQQGIKFGQLTVCEIINEQPTADVAEVVRCKDCKFRKIEFGWNGKKYKMCTNTDYLTDDDAYCSYGERREDE